VLIWISDYFELSCWNLCSCYNDIFEYMNLLIIELLLMKSLAQDAYIWIIVFCAKLVWNNIVVVVLLMISWSIGVVVVMRCCCCEFMLWVFRLWRLWWNLSCCWKFYENGLEMNKLILLSIIKLFMMRLMYKWLEDITMKNWVCLSLILNLGRA